MTAATNPGQTAAETADYDRRSHVEDFCHQPIEQDADGLWSCNARGCARDCETQRACEDACLANYLESEASR